MFIVEAQFGLKARWWETQQHLCTIAGPYRGGSNFGVHRNVFWEADTRGSADALAASLRRVPGVTVEVVADKF